MTPRTDRDEAVGLVPTGIANLEAVAAAFRRLGCSVRELDGPDEIAGARYVVLPGVGSFDSGMEALESRGWAAPLRRRIEGGAPTLAICLGMQLLCEASHEAPGVRGLGCIPGRVARFGDEVRVPQLGWNRVHAPPGLRYLRTGFFYFANSYRLEAAPPGWGTARSRYGGSFAAAVERGGTLACQFHPELSGVAGQRLLARWLEEAPGAPDALRAERADAGSRERASC